VPDRYQQWRLFRSEFPIIAICLEHGAAAVVLVLILELIKLLLAIFGAPKAWHYIDVGDVFLTGDIAIVAFLAVHTCYKIWRSH
jgi:hypothetical protein